MKVDLDKYLKEFFGHDEFLLSQREVIESILSGKDTIAIFPTGGGKSLCYQLPAIIFPGTTIVISPLISLMKDQVDELRNLGIESAYISSSLSDSEISITLRNMEKGHYKIIYIAPERFYSDDFIESVKNIDIPFIAIDEAHCVSQWGHNFRPAYLKIKDLIDALDNPIVAAFTATATEKVKGDIEKLLGLKGKSQIFAESFDRPNLKFIVEKNQDKTSYILGYIRRNINKPGIIYAATRANVEEIHFILKDKGFKSGMYHAGLDSYTRNNTQDAFLKGHLDVMVATNAFGMGIDKSDVRYIIHYNMPKSLENYYQEAGRAGRDGEPSDCIILYSERDYGLNSFMIKGNYPPLSLVKRLYKRILDRGESGISQEFILRSKTIDRYTLQSALRKLFEYDYVSMVAGTLYPVAEKEFQLSQKEIDRHMRIELDRLEAIEDYSEGESCLRRFILEYFDEKTSIKNCGNCSVCSKERNKKVTDFELDKLLNNIFDN